MTPRLRARLLRGDILVLGQGLDKTTLWFVASSDFECFPARPWRIVLGPKSKAELSP